ncbi:Cap protein [Histomonas meleagridis]|uniref:Cap protein n=1 Tax=Histomonas meleagridis TaxID=135588 RepID=UPI00355AA89E|nr:Cap protein [Histomonas meleagridis]KAH0797971.1 Cap protein [Histomonas meleagridis]
MPRRLRRRSYSRGRPLKTVKYSNETFNCSGNITFNTGSGDSAVGDQVNTTLISAVATQGMRKVKNFTLKMITDVDIPLLWGLVYVPDGTVAQSMSLGTPAAPVSLYEPNQNVIKSGYLTPNAQQTQVFRTRLARNLNSGDSIALCLKVSVPGTEITEKFLGVQLNYVITY